MPEQALSRVIDNRLPITWILTIMGMAVAAGFGLFYKVDRHGETLRDMQGDLKELKTYVNADNTQAVKLVGEIAILRHRIEQLEAQFEREHHHPVNK